MSKLARAVLLTGFFIGASLVLTSCIGSDSTIVINSDGSGSVSLSYTISKMISTLGKLEEGDKTVPLPVGKEDFERTVNKIPGLILKNYKESENEDDVTIQADISFNQVSQLSDFLDGGDAVTLTTASGRSTFTYNLYSGRNSQPDEQTVQFLETYFEDYAIVLHLRAPQNILQVNIGSISGDQREATVNIPVTKIIKEKDPVIWEIVW